MGIGRLLDKSLNKKCDLGSVTASTDTALILYVLVDRVGSLEKGISVLVTYGSIPSGKASSLSLSLLICKMGIITGQTIVLRPKQDNRWM